MSSLDAILMHAPARLIDLIAPRPLLMILARNDAIAPPDSIRNAFARAGERERLLEIEGGHYSIYSGQGADKAGQAAVEWFTEHLLNPKPLSPAPANMRKHSALKRWTPTEMRRRIYENLRW